MKEQLLQISEELKQRLWEMSDYIHDHPELGNQEFEAVNTLTSFLKEHNFSVEVGVAGLETAFTAVYDSKKPGLSVAYLCEYDALPDLGHGCGHNMIGVMSAGAGVLLSKIIDEVGGKVYVFGTPAEETNGAKVTMAEAGLFNEMDAVMMVHPDGYTTESGTSLAMEALQFDYTGRPSHAAASPENGINALNAVIQLFNGIDALRQHVKSDVRMHGIITNGGVAANIVPEHATAQFYIRAATKEYLAVVKEKVLNIAQGAALITGTTVEISNYELSYDDLKTNQVLSNAFNENLRQLGMTDIHPAKKETGSVDIGNISNICPTIHPYIGIGDCKIVGHSQQMVDATVTSLAHERLVIAALALAYTGYDVLSESIKLK
ncbi:MAG: M20 family metallopeptidase [Turicibacter sanguinis]|uniref:M20 family metallopeptidase n=1 Tax=Turicibacter sanguinis TaxID=154288 RepID=UPI00399554A0